MIRLGGTLLAAAFILLSMTLLAGRGRIYHDGVKTLQVATEKDALDAWLKHGMKGRILLIFDRLYSFDRVPEDRVASFLKDPGRAAMTVTDMNFMYLALRANVFRKAYYVVPDDKWPAFVKSLGAKQASLEHQKGFVDNIEGVPIIAIRYGDLPQFTEKTLVFQSARVESLLEAKALDDLAGKHGSDFVIVCAAP